MAVVLAGAVAVGGQAAAAKPEPNAKRTCTAGHTLYRQDGVRIFSMLPRDSDGNQYEVFLACRPGSRRPAVLRASSHCCVTVNWLGARLEGKRVIWQVEEFADGGGGTFVGWYDVRTGEHRSGGVNWLFGHVDAATVAPDGAIAIAARLGATDDTIGYMARGRHRLHQPRAIAKVPEGIVPGSLRVQGTTVTWTTAAGVVGSAPIGG